MKAKAAIEQEEALAVLCRNFGKRYVQHCGALGALLKRMPKGGRSTLVLGRDRSPSCPLDLMTYFTEYLQILSLVLQSMVGRE